MNRLPGSLRDPWVLGQILLFLLIGSATWYGRSSLDGPPASGSRDAALVLIGIAALLGLAAGFGLGRSLTATVVPVEKGQLVTRGLYGWVRHPIYLAVILLLTGIALLAGRWWPGLLVALVTYGYFDRKAAAEERYLVRRYADYEAYRQRVGKLLPRLWRRGG
jgi:protein-S-isoprenylcysteine O-methyltransferase Ste14